MNASTQELKPCPHVLSALERIAEGKERGGLFMWYVKKHVEKCSHCAEALDALQCYQDAVKMAYEDTLKEGETDLTPRDLVDILNSVRI